MTEVTLGKYCEEIESLIDEGSFDAAISHCQHILKAYPKYLQAYRLLGNAVLEKGDLEAASDLFSRVLSIDPFECLAEQGRQRPRHRHRGLETVEKVLDVRVMIDVGVVMQGVVSKR